MHRFIIILLNFAEYIHDDILRVNILLSWRDQCICATPDETNYNFLWKFTANVLVDLRAKLILLSDTWNRIFRSRINPGTSAQGVTQQDPSFVLRILRLIIKYWTNLRIAERRIMTLDLLSSWANPKSSNSNILSIYIDPQIFPSCSQTPCKYVTLSHVRQRYE